MRRTYKIINVRPRNEKLKKNWPYMPHQTVSDSQTNKSREKFWNNPNRAVGTILARTQRKSTRAADAGKNNKSIRDWRLGGDKLGDGNVKKRPTYDSEEIRRSRLKTVLDATPKRIRKAPERGKVNPSNETHTGSQEGTHSSYIEHFASEIQFQRRKARSRAGKRGQIIIS